MASLTRVGDAYSSGYPSNSFRMCFVKKEDDLKYHQLMNPQTCRDYLGEVLHWEACERKGRSFGGTWAPESKEEAGRIDRDAIRLSVQTSPLEDLRSNVIAMLNEVEFVNEFAPSKLIDVDSHCVIIEGDPIWISSTLMLSVYTLMLRVSNLRLASEKHWVYQLNPRMGDYRYVAGIGADRLVHVLNSLKDIAPLYKRFGVNGWDPASSSHASLVHGCSGLLAYADSPDAYSTACYYENFGAYGVRNPWRRTVQEILAGIPYNSKPANKDGNEEDK